MTILKQVKRCLETLSLLFDIYLRLFFGFFLLWTGDSANAVPPTKKLRTRVTRIWGDRRCQPIRSAMEKPQSGRTAVFDHSTSRAR